VVNGRRDGVSALGSHEGRRFRSWERWAGWGLWLPIEAGMTRDTFGPLGGHLYPAS
jgi:hypothetical protein